MSFPPTNSLTDQPTLTVRGTVSVPTGIDGVTVGGVAAQSTDGFVHWSAVVPLAVGAQDVSVVVASASAPPPVTLHVDRRATLAIDPRLLALDAAGGRAFAVSGSGGVENNVIRAIDLATGAQTVVSGPTKGAGPMFDDSFYTLSWDPTSKRLLAFDTDDLWSIDPTTGDRQILLAKPPGGPPWPGEDSEAEVDPQQNRILATTETSVTLMSVDLTTHAIAVRSGSESGLPAVGAGPQLDQVRGLALDLPNGRALVVDDDFSTGLASVDLATGDRTLLSGPMGPGMGAWTVLPDSVARFGGRAFISSYLIPDVVSIDLATAARSYALDEGIGSGPLVLELGAIEADAAGILATDARLDAIVRVNPDTLERTIVSSYGIGAGRAFLTPAAVQWDPFTDRIVVSDLGGLQLVDPETGDRTLVSSAQLNVGAGLFPTGYADDIEVTATAFYLAHQTTILRIDRATGDRTPFTGLSMGMMVGAGPGITKPVFGTASSADGSQFYLLQTDGTAMRVDPATGDRTILSSATVGMGPAIMNGRDIALDPAGNRLIATSDVGAVYAIDLATGDRTEISSITKGSGPPCFGYVMVQPDGIWVTYQQTWTHIDPSTGDRTRVLDSGVPGPGYIGTGHMIRPDGRFYSTDFSLGGLLAIDRGTGERVVLSR